MRRRRFAVPLALALWSAPGALADVNGRILSPDGEPLTSATVIGYAPETASERAGRLVEGTPRSPVAVTEADTHGAFRLDRVPAVVDIVVTALGFAPAFASVADHETVTLALSPASTVRGRVLAHGGPVVGATVAWKATTPPALSGETLVRTGRDGSYEISDPEIWASGVVITHPDFVPSETGVDPFGFESPLSLQHELDDGVTIAGTVIEGPGGRAVEGAVIEVDGWPLARSSLDGSFLVRHAPSSWQRLAARVPGLVGAATRVGGDAVVVMGPARELRGAVLDAETRRPLAGAVVAVADGRLAVAASTITDARGRYVLAQLAPASYHVWSSRPGYASSYYSPAGTDLIDLRRVVAGDLDLRLTPLLRVTGRVQDEQGQPLSGVLVLPWSRDLPSVYSSPADFGGFSGAWTTGDGLFVLRLEDDRAGESGGALLALKPGYAAGRLDLDPDGGAPGSITLTPGTELTGRIRTADGEPVPGVSISFAEANRLGGAPSEFLSGSPEGGWTTSDERGRFRTRVHPVGHDVTFAKSGFVPKAVRVRHPAEESPLDVVLAPAVELRGAILRSDGTGIPGVQVYLAADHAMSPAFTTTSAEGEFLLEDLSPGTYELYFTKEGTALSGSRTVSVPDNDARIELDPVATVRGWVVEATSRVPVERFSVDLEPFASTLSAGFPAHYIPAIEASGGAFTIEEVPVGEATLTVRAEGFVTRQLGRLAIPPGDDLGVIEITLDRGARLHGLVTDELGRPLPDVDVSAKGDDGEAASVETNARGEYDLRGVTPGRVSLEFRRPGYVTARRTLDTAVENRVDATLDRGLVVKGVVLAEGAGVPGAGVRAHSPMLHAETVSASTDESGRFTLEGLVPGRYTVEAHTMEGGEATIEDVDAADSEWLRLLVKRPETAILSGWVTGLSDTDIIQSVVVRARGEGGGSGYAHVDESGWFRMEKAPTGSVTVQATATTLEGAERSTRVGEITLFPDSEEEVQLEFADGLAVSGYVTREGAPVAGARVRFEATDSSGLAAAARSGSDGHYEVVGLEPGPYRVSAWAREASHSAEHTLAGDTQIDLDITASMLAGLVLDASSSSPLADASISFWRLGPGENTPDQSTRSDPRGQFASRSMEPGRYRVLASKQGFGQGVAEVDVRRGETAEVEIALEPSEGLTLVVVDDRDGRPLDATVVVRDTARRIVANRSSPVGGDGSLNVALGPGAYLLSTSADGYGTATRRVEVPGAGLRIGLTPGGTLVLESERVLRGRVRLVGADGEEYVRCWCNGLADIDLDGRRTTVENVTPGRYTLEILEKGGVSSAMGALVREGQTLRIAVP